MSETFVTSTKILVVQLFFLEAILQNFIRHIGLIFTFIFLTAFVANAQNPVSLSINVAPSSVPAGGKGTAKVTANIGGGWYMYSITQGGGGPTPTRVWLDGGPFKAGGVSGPKPKVKFDENFQMKSLSKHKKSIEL